jgi:hypothetical protein
MLFATRRLKEEFVELLTERFVEAFRCWELAAQEALANPSTEQVVARGVLAGVLAEWVTFEAYRPPRVTRA